MRHARARLSLLVAVAATGVVVPAAGAEPGVVAASGGVPAGPTVTLLTGDTVTIGGAHGADVRAAEGRGHITFFTEKDERGDLHVVPEDAVSLLSRGKLDPQLFNVTELVRLGYGGRSRLPLIVDYNGPAPHSAAAQVGVAVGEVLLADNRVGQ